MPDLSTNETRQSYLPFTPPSGTYFGFIRSVERLKGDHNKSRYATDFHSAAAWRHQFKFIVTHDQAGNPLPHIGIASFAEFLNSNKGNLIRLKAALHGIDLETAKRANLPHSNDLIAMPVWLRFDRVEGVNSGGRPFIQTNIADIGLPPPEWRDYLFSWLQHVGLEKKVLANSNDQYLSSPQPKRACELSDAELQQYGFQNFSVLGAVQQQRAAMHQQSQQRHIGGQQPPPQHGFPNAGAPGQVPPPNGQQIGATPAFGQPPTQQAGYAQPPAQTFAQPPAAQQPYQQPPGSPAPRAAQPPFATPPANSQPYATPPAQQLPPPAQAYAQPPATGIPQQQAVPPAPATPPNGFQPPPQFAMNGASANGQHTNGEVNWGDVNEIPM